MPSCPNRCWRVLPHLKPVCLSVKNALFVCHDKCATQAQWSCWLRALQTARPDSGFSGFCALSAF